MIPKKILFCADFSENSEPARQFALDYAKAFGAQLMLVHIIDTSGFPSYGDCIGDEMEHIVSRVKQSVLERLESMAKECAAVVPDVKTFCRLGSPAEGIVSLARDESADLIVIGTHGRTGVKHLVMGSIARSVLRMAHRPVLIVEAPATKG